MDISGLSNSGLVALAQAMQASRQQERVSMAVAKMANDQIKQTGANMLELIAAASPEGAAGHHIDTWA